MKISTLGCLLLPLIYAAGCNMAGKSSVCENTTADGYRTLTHNGVEREYILYTPTGYDGSEARPLIINFHGNGGCASDFQAYEADLSNEAEANNFLVAYPQGVVRAKGNAEWNPGDVDSQEITDNDLVFVEQLIADISNDFTVDASRIYATGYSNGGMMAYGLACRRGGLIAAAGIMSGIMLSDTCNESDYTSIIHFHGTSDGALPYDGDANYQSVSDVVSFWVSHNNIPGTSPETTTHNSGNVTQDTYSGGEEGTSVVLYTINNGGHVWFTDTIGGAHPNQILWDFLSGTAN